jgi:hypothetical protein
VSALTWAASQKGLTESHRLALIALAVLAGTGATVRCRGGKLAELLELPLPDTLAVLRNLVDAGLLVQGRTSDRFLLPLHRDSPSPATVTLPAHLIDGGQP